MGNSILCLSLNALQTSDEGSDGGGNLLGPASWGLWGGQPLGATSWGLWGNLSGNLLLEKEFLRVRPEALVACRHARVLDDCVSGRRWIVVNQSISVARVLVVLRCKKE